jgi:hypothetical protein
MGMGTPGSTLQVTVIDFGGGSYLRDRLDVMRT